MMNPNFIHILLCDNDYGQELEQHSAKGSSSLMMNESKAS